MNTEPPFLSAPPAARVISSGEPPAGVVVVKGHGWRVALPVALLSALASALAMRLISDEERLRDQSAHLQELERACAKLRP